MNAKTYHITLNGKVFEVQVEEVAAGQPMPTPTAAPAAPAPAAAAPAGSGQTITAPMPGTILNVAVRSGQHVKKGDVVAILEAMKMENEIVSPADGTVGNISVDKGQAVELGAAILEIV
ncbi:MAG: acetyl-CoA carboxylase biotin carboxyl carrier protein subunit [Epulopiscium sp. Nele67-Bin002]|nr:MAG: acetyl-CoA carboxylase biotin carboxyl carrier protein subunit [Epulopiscium sp. Nuni2H_MBin001]OON91753.1 MAG: acetyl-CoA carboxylase biotin carboxyl carrier protein subunit [Epulopiscium sp. Nele67-Bin002]OON93208.1 MAG: acetyl-CoA carboxylase biotin carboxyl carrier protein subunit [Epulopiscium sp. Nele67-Bin001]